jgi:hypothetical protein
MKILLWIVGIVFALLVGVGAYVALFSGDLVKSAIETYAPPFLGADVRVGKVDLSLAEGSGQLQGLQIDNPQGFGGGSAMKLGNIKVVLDPAQISQELVVLERVEIDGAEIAAIAKGGATNLQQLMDNVTAALGQESNQDAGSQVKLIINRLDFTNAKTSVSSDVLGELSVQIPDIHLTDVGRESNGATIGEVIQQLLDPVYKSVSKELVAQGLDLDIEGMKSKATQGVREQVSDKLGGGLKSITEKFGRGE